jgi:zinc protease
MVCRSTAVLVLICSTISLFGQTLPAPQKVTTVEGVTEYRLANGMRVLLFPDPSRPTVTVNNTILVGSRHEGYGETGMAHLLEHMVFKGTPQHPDIPKALRDHGANFNGTTNVDRTNYFETLPATDENLEFAIRLEADRMVNSLIRREDLLSEMTVVRNEFERGENSPEAILNQRMEAVAYEWHNYGKSTIGNRSDIERVPIENLQAFYKKFYQPDNAVLIIGGKFDEAKALNWVNKYFGSIPRPTRQLDKTYTEEPAQDGERLVTLRRVGSVAVVGAAYHIVAAAHPDFSAFEILENVMASEPSGRLYQALVVPKLASTVNGSAFGGHDPGLIQFMASCEPKNVAPVKEVLIKTLETVADRPITSEEVERARKQLLRRREQIMNDAGRVVSMLSEAASKGDWRLFFLNRDRLEKVSTDDVNRVAIQTLRRSNRTLGEFLPTQQPERTEIAATPNLADQLKDYQGRQAMAAGEAFEPTPANIDARTQVVDLGGIKAALLPRKTRGEQASVQVVLRYGNEDSLKGNNVAGQMLGTLMMRGTQSLNRQQIRDELDKIGARIMPAAAGLGSVGFSVTCKKDGLAKAIDLLGDILRHPSFPADEFEQLKRETRQSLQRGLTEPMNLGANMLQRKLAPYPADNVRYVPTIEESLARLDEVTLDQIKALYREQLSGKHGEVAAVGDFDSEPLVQQFKGIFNGWESAIPYRRISRPAATGIAGEKINILTPDKANAVYLAGMVLPMNDLHPDFVALDLGNFLLGGGTLSSRLGNRVRQRDGLSYGVSSNFTAAALDPAARFSIFAIANPENIDKVDAAIAEELNRFITDGVSLTELDDGKKAFLEQMKLQWANDRRLVGQLVENLHDGRTFAYFSELERRLQAVSPAEIQAAFKKHIVPGNLVIIRAGDFKKSQ